MTNSARGTRVHVSDDTTDPPCIVGWHVSPCCLFLQCVLGKFPEWSEPRYRPMFEFCTCHDTLLRSHNLDHFDEPCHVETELCPKLCKLDMETKLWLMSSGKFYNQHPFKFQQIDFEKNIFYVTYVLHSPYCVSKHKNMLVDFQKDIEYQFSISNDLPGEEHWVQILFWWKCVSEARGHLSLKEN